MRPLRLASQLHSSLLRSLIALLQIAASAACDQVIPSVRSAHPSWNHMVDGELFAFRPAVLAGVVVSGQDRVTREPELWHGTTNRVAHLQDRRCRQGTLRRLQRSVSILQNFRLAKKQQREGASHVTDVKRFVVVVQHKYFVNSQDQFSCKKMGVINSKSKGTKKGPHARASGPVGSDKDERIIVSRPAGGQAK